jgi:hypothetical protein
MAARSTFWTVRQANRKATDGEGRRHDDARFLAVSNRKNAGLHSLGRLQARLVLYLKAKV